MSGVNEFPSRHVRPVHYIYLYRIPIFESCERDHTTSPLSLLRITYSQRGWPPLFRPRSQFHHRVSFFFFFSTFVPKFHPAIVPPPRPREYTAFSRGLIPLNRDLVRLERDWFSLNKFQ